MDPPRVLLVPEFTELMWTIKPRLAEWAEVASYDPPGIGGEPLPEGGPKSLRREMIVERGLEELDRRGWHRCFVVADGWGIAAAVGVAEERRSSVLGMALGHATLSFRRDGDRPATNAAVYDALTQLVRQDHEAFIRYGIAQTTGGSVGERLAQQMLERFPKDLLLVGWERITADDEHFGPALCELDVPLLLAEHDGCLMSTAESFEDARRALPGARTVSVRDAPSTSEDFAVAVREFCEEISRRSQRPPAGR